MAYLVFAGVTTFDAFAIDLFFLKQYGPLTDLWDIYL